MGCSIEATDDLNRKLKMKKVWCFYFISINKNTTDSTSSSVCDLDRLRFQSDGPRKSMKESHTFKYEKGSWSAGTWPCTIYISPNKSNMMANIMGSMIECLQHLQQAFREYEERFYVIVPKCWDLQEPRCHISKFRPIGKIFSFATWRINLLLSFSSNKYQ